MKGMCIIGCVVAASFPAVASAGGVVWGSFDSSRINYSAGALNGDAHIQLRGIITANGDSVAAGTSTITDSYLSGVDVFYTSLLNTTTGYLSAAEKTSLDNWVAGGGTLIVTAEYLNPDTYEDYTAAYGVGNYFGLANRANGTPVGSHPIMDGISSFFIPAECTFTYGPDAELIGINAFGDDFMVVLEPSTGYTGGGRVLVMGDHNMFTDTYIFDEDNFPLAQNMVEWAADSGGFSLSLSGSCPGTVTADVSGATPGGNVAFIFANGTGSVTIPSGNPCAGTVLDLNGSAQLIRTETADGSGNVTVSGSAPSGACGGYIQALDVATCTTSNVEQL
ncbi:MAG: DUF4350 domain-containing protein [Phycisphaerales bacterium]